MNAHALGDTDCEKNLESLVSRAPNEIYSAQEAGEQWKLAGLPKPLALAWKQRTDSKPRATEEDHLWMAQQTQNYLRDNFGIRSSVLKKRHPALDMTYYEVRVHPRTPSEIASQENTHWLAKVATKLSETGTALSLSTILLEPAIRASAGYQPRSINTDQLLRGGNVSLPWESLTSPHLTSLGAHEIVHWITDLQLRPATDHYKYHLRNTTNAIESVQLLSLNNTHAELKLADGTTKQVPRGEFLRQLVAIETPSETVMEPARIVNHLKVFSTQPKPDGPFRPWVRFTNITSRYPLVQNYDGHHALEEGMGARSQQARSEAQLASRQLEELKQSWNPTLADNLRRQLKKAANRLEETLQFRNTHREVFSDILSAPTLNIEQTAARIKVMVPKGGAIELDKDQVIRVTGDENITGRSVRNFLVKAHNEYLAGFHDLENVVSELRGIDAEFRRLQTTRSATPQLEPALSP